MPKDETIANGQTLLTDALSDPLAEEPARRWFEHLIAVAPLWAFQAKAYVHVHGSELPTTYPLRLMVESIQEDDKPPRRRRKPKASIRELMEPAKQSASVTPKRHAPVTTHLDPLPATLDRRRLAVATGRFGGGVLGIAQPQPPEFYPREIANLALAEPEPVPGIPVSRYELLGYELVEQIEDVAFASNDPARDKAKKALTMFLTDMQARIARGGQSLGPPKRVLKALVMQGRKLFETCWETLLDFEVCAEARSLLESQGVTDDLDQRRWAARLTLAMLSNAEIVCTQSQARKAANWTKMDPPPTSRLHTIWILARRLRLNPVTVADKTLGGKASTFFNGSNPCS